MDKFKLKVLSPSEALIGEIKIDPVVEFYDIVTKKNKKGVTGKAILQTHIEIPDSDKNEINLQLQLTYQACTAKYCLLPKRIPIELKIPIKQKTSTQIISDNTTSEVDLLQKAAQKGYLSLFLFVFIAGLLTSFTPCIYPMIPITLAILGNPSHGGSRSMKKRFFISLTYVLGIALTYSLLGLLAATTGALFGSLLGHPIAVFFISLFFLLMGLSMLGLFEIQAPAFIRNKMQNTKATSGYIGAFFSGLVAGVIAGPCVGPVLVSILAIVAQNQNQVLGFFLLMTFALGFGQLFLILGTFSHLIKFLPKSGRWMNGIKYIFGLMLIGASLYFSWPVLQRYVFTHKEVQNTHSLPWQNYSEELVKKAQQDQRPIIIDFWADWCGACIELEQKSFSHSDVKQFLQTRNFLLLKFDATLDSEDLDALKRKYKIVGLPHIVFYNSQGKWRDDLTLKGYEDYLQLLQRLNKVDESLQINK